MPPQNSNEYEQPPVNPQQPQVAPPPPDPAAQQPVTPPNWPTQPQSNYANQPLQPAQPVYGQPMQPAAPMPGATSSHDHTGLAIAGLVTSFIIAPIGLILSIVALAKSGGNTAAKIMSIIGIAISSLGMLVFLLIVIGTFGGVQQRAKDTKYKTDLYTIQSQLEGSYATNGTYPSLAQLNDPSWRTTNMSGLSSDSLSPSSDSHELVSGEPTDQAYAYTTTPSDCDGSTSNPCKSYVLEANDSKGKRLTINSLN